MRKKGINFILKILVGLHPVFSPKLVAFAPAGHIIPVQYSFVATARRRRVSNIMVFSCHTRGGGKFVARVMNNLAGLLVSQTWEGKKQNVLGLHLGCCRLKATQLLLSFDKCFFSWVNRKDGGSII